MHFSDLTSQKGLRVGMGEELIVRLEADAEGGKKRMNEDFDSSKWRDSVTTRSGNTEVVVLWESGEWNLF